MDERITTSGQFDYFLNFLGTPAGIISCLVFIALLVLMWMWRPGRWIALTLMMWTATFGFATGKWFKNPLSFPLSILQNHGRGLATGLLMLLVLPALFEGRGWRRRVVSGGAVFFFMLELVFTGRVMFGGDLVRGIAGGGIFLALFIVLGVGISKQLQSIENMIVLLRCIVVAAMLVIVGTIYQLLVNRGAIIGGNRLYATTPNPQYAAMIFAFALLPACFLLARKQEPLKLRALWSIVVGFLVLFLLWTGSRTGALMSVVGLGLLFRLRIGKLLGVGIVAAVVFMIALQFFSSSTETAGRLLSTQDNRTAAWRLLIEEFVAHPVVGYLRYSQMPAIVENSYLSTAARLGLMGLAPLGMMMIAVARSLLYLWRRRTMLGRDAIIVDLMIGVMATIAVGAMFEGFLLGTLTYMVFCIYIYLAIVAFLVDWLSHVSRSQEILPDDRALAVDNAWAAQQAY